MRTYSRARIAGGVYFFTTNLAERHDNDLPVRHIVDLRGAFRRTRQDNPFVIEAIVILPEHLHCLWRLPVGDANFPTRWRLIKARFSRCIASEERISESRQRKGERGLWQRRYWEHVIRDERDYRCHLDTSTSIPSNMVMSTQPETGRILHFIAGPNVGYPVDWAAPSEIAESDWE